MRKILYLLIAFCAVASNAQSPIPFSIKKSAIFKDVYKFSGINFVENDNHGGSIIIRWYEGSLLSGKSGYLFEHYDSDLKLLGTYDYPVRFTEALHQSSILGIVMDKDTIHVVDFLYNSKDKIYTCSAITATVNDFNFVKKELFRLSIDEIKQPGFFAGKWDQDTYASMAVNSEGTAFAVSVDLKNPDYESHKLYLYDNKVYKKFDYTFKRTIQDKDFKYQNIVVNKAGDAIYLLGKVSDKESKDKKEGGRYKYELTKISKEQEKAQSFETSEHFVGLLNTIVLQDRIACVGLYSDLKEDRYKGVSYFEFDPESLQLRKSNFNLFT